MTHQEKSVIIAGLVDKFKAYDCFYLVDPTSISVEAINQFRRNCREAGVVYQVAKNTLIIKALDSLKNKAINAHFQDRVLKGFSGILFAKEEGNVPAKLVIDFRKQLNLAKPIFKGASIDGELFIGEEQLATLLTIKSRITLIGEIIALLKSPITHVVGALQNSKYKLSGILKTLANRNA